MTDRHIQSAVLRYWITGKTLFLSVIIGKAISFTWKLILGRLGAETLGATEVTLTILFTLQAFSLLGLQMPLMRYTTKRTHAKRADAYFFLTLRVVSLISMCIVLFGYAFPHVVASWFGKTVDIARISVQYIFVVPLLAASELMWTQWVSRGHLSLYAFGKYILPPMSRLLMILAVIFLGAHIHIAIAHVAFAGLITFMVSAALSKNIIHTPTQKLSLHDTRDYIRYSAPVTGSFLLFAVYGASDVIFTGRILGAESVGILSIAVLFADVPSVILTPLLTVFQTHLKTYKTMRQAREFGYANMKILSSLCACFIFAGMLLFPFLIPGIMGVNYSISVRIAQLLLVGTAVETAIILPMRHMLDYYGHTSATLASMAITACIKILVLTLTVPHHGLMGVVYAQWAAVSIHAVVIFIANVFLMPSRTASKSR